MPEDDEEENDIRQTKRSLEFFERSALQRLTGLPMERAYEFVAKEGLDNALDKKDVRNITVSIEQTAAGDELSISDDGRQEFTEQDVGKLLDFDYAPSTKRFLKSLTRGILGSALQCMVGLSRVSWNNNGPEYTFVISSSGKTYRVFAIRENDKISTRHETENIQDDGTTTISVLLPSDSVKRNEIRDIVRRMHWVNPHVNFSFTVNGQSQYYKAEEGAKDPLARWKGRAGNPRWYTEEEVLGLARSFRDSLPVRKFFSLFDGVRDRRYAQKLLSQLDIDPDRQLSELNDQGICAIFQKLKSDSVRANAKTLPTLGKTHYQKLLGHRFIRYKRIYGEDKRGYPWILELVSFSDVPRVYEFVNFSFSGSKRPFTSWSYPCEGEKTINIEPLVEKRKLALIIHAVSPCFLWDDAGKGHLDVSPFDHLLADAVKSILKQPTSDKDAQIKLLREVLEQRAIAVKNDPAVLEKDPWTQSTVFYLTRNRAGDTKLNRRYLTQQIRDECLSLGYTREELGIYAASRAELYFRGEWYPVSIKNVEELMRKGTDIIAVEKEALAEVLAPYAAQKGIALLNSRGFLVEYAKRLLELAERYGARLSIVTDLDASGLFIAQKAGMLDKRLAVSIGMVKKLGLELAKVEEHYKPKENHLSELRETVEISDPDTFNYIQHMRIEIDSIIAEVKAQKFWEYLLEELLMMHPTRDYGRAIEVDTDVIVHGWLEERYPSLIDSARKSLDATKQSYLRKRRKVKGFRDVAKEEEKLRKLMRKKLKVLRD